MRNFKQFLSENQLVDIEADEIKIENGIMIPNQFPDEVNLFECNGLFDLTSLENCPTKVNDFYCNWTSITSLKYAPKIIGDFFSCTGTDITSLDYAPLKCNSFDCAHNKVLHLKGIGRSYLKDCKYLILNDSVKSNILGLCRIKNLKFIYIKDEHFTIVTSGDLYEAIEIVKKHLNTDGSDCQEELIQNGFNDYAKF